MHLRTEMYLWTRRWTRSSAAERRQKLDRCRAPRQGPRLMWVLLWWAVEERLGGLLQPRRRLVASSQRPWWESSLLLWPHPSPRKCHRGQLRENQQETLFIRKQLGDSGKGWYSVTALTLFRANGVKIPTAASVVHTHGVTLTFPQRVEGAAATHTGLCGNVVHVSVKRFDPVQVQKR